MSFRCYLCEKSFGAKSNCNRHLREVHKANESSLDMDSKLGNNRCLEQNGDSFCGIKFANIKSLIEHLQITHSKCFDMQLLHMKNMQEFMQWKTNIEAQNKCSYILKSRKFSSKGEVMHYICNRSKASYTPLTNECRKRLQKSQGSCKLEHNCTSFINVKNESDVLLVEWQKVHYGHTNDLEHIRIPQPEKQNIASKLMSGVTVRRILESTRDRIGSDLNRIDLLTVQDVKNIGTSFLIEGKDGKRSKDDAFSVELWVRECESLDVNPILFYKRQGQEHAILKKEDFCLVIMNNFQRQMIKKFKKIITVDSTHGLNSYDFELTTVMVIDEFHHGFPVAEMFSNRKDTTIQHLYFSLIKETVGEISCEIFMSDMDETFFKAWILVMGVKADHLYCSWHVDRAWQSNLNKIGDKEKRASVYKMVKILQQYTSEDSFYLALENAVQSLCSNPSTKKFGEYFKNTYTHNFRKWAYCFRRHSSINTNMHLESMHKVIKYFYLERKTVKRLDKGLNVVLRYVRDKSIERIIRLTKGEHTKITSILSRNHGDAIKEISQYTVLSCDNYWKIIKSNHSSSYEVHQKLDKNCCQQICTICKICNHMYSCTCDFFIKRQTMCKHIHIIISSINTTNVDINHISSRSSDSFEDKTTLILDNLKALSCNSSKTAEESDKHTKPQISKIKYLIGELGNSNFEGLNDSVIDQIHRCLIVANNLKGCHEKPEVISDQFQIKNKQLKRVIEPQLRFTSTKKKRVETAASFKRPTTQEVLDIHENLKFNNSSDKFIAKSKSPSHDHQYC